MDELSAFRTKREGHAPGHEQYLSSSNRIYEGIFLALEHP
jgi:hypothetical protein